LEAPHSGRAVRRCGRGSAGASFPHPFSRFPAQALPCQKLGPDYRRSAGRRAARCGVRDRGSSEATRWRRSGDPRSAGTPSICSTNPCCSIRCRPP